MFKIGAAHLRRVFEDLAERAREAFFDFPRIAHTRQFSSELRSKAEHQVPKRTPSSEGGILYRLALDQVALDLVELSLGELGKEELAVRPRLLEVQPLAWLLNQRQARRCRLDSGTTALTAGRLRNKSENRW